MLDVEAIRGEGMWGQSFRVRVIRRAMKLSGDAANVAKMFMTAGPDQLPQVLERREGDGYTKACLRELLAFGFKEALSCLFPVFIFLMLGLTKFVMVPFVPRYDLLLITCLLMQWWMYRRGLETKRDLMTICVFHLLGIAMEIFKVHHGSWEYPEFAYSKVGGVPLYSGFMYGSVASYICQAWRRFNLKLEHWPSLSVSVAFAVVIYGNFYANRYVSDIRFIIIPLLILAFVLTSVHFETNGVVRRMPVILSFVLISLFLWFAENVGTSLGAWRYPYQEGAWTMVRPHIITSWFLLCIVSVIIVVLLEQLETGKYRFSREECRMFPTS